jgi:hypothetical protein
MLVWVEIEDGESGLEVDPLADERVKGPTDWRIAASCDYDSNMLWEWGQKRTARPLLWRPALRGSFRNKC